MTEIEKIVASVNILDIDVVVVGPAGGPGLGNLKVITAVGEMRSASDHVYVTDGEVMVVAEVRLVMLIRNPPALFVVFFLPSVLVLSLLVMILLGKSGHSPTQKEGSTDAADYC
jgi:hypothetical protein